MDQQTLRRPGPLTTRAILCQACLVWLLMLVGCESDGQTGRIDVTRTTEAELKDDRVLPVALVEFSDQVPQQLTHDLNQIREIRDAPGRVAVIMGDLNNKTRIVSSDEFELTRSRIRNNLLQSQFMRGKIRFVEDQARMDQLRQRELGLAGSTHNSLDPSTTFALNGDFYRISRGDTNQYYFEFQLVHFQTHEIVFSKRYDIKQVKR